MMCWKQMRLRGADECAPQCSRLLAADDKGRAAVGDRAAIENLQRRGDRPRGQHILDRDRIAELRARMQRRVPAQQHRELGKVRFGDAELVHVA